MGATLRVLSANLWSGGAHPEAFAELVVELGADVVAVQELAPDQADALAEVMPHGTLDPATEYRGMGLVARNPGALSRIPLPLRDARVMRLDPAHWPGLERPVEIVNLHISAPHSIAPQPGPWLRFKQMRELERFFHAERERETLRDSRLLVGDFNATPLWPVYRRIARHYNDAAVVAAQRGGQSPRRTWGPWPGAPRLLRIDHGFTRGLEVEDFHVVAVRGSDHSAVVVDLRVG